MNPEPKPMTPEESLNILVQATAKFVGTRDDHAAIQTALNTYAALINSTQTKEPKP